jgi:hypothetical protein
MGPVDLRMWECGGVRREVREAGREIERRHLLVAAFLSLGDDYRMP